MHFALTAEQAGLADADTTQPIPGWCEADIPARAAVRPAPHVDLELVLPVVNREEDVGPLLAGAAACLLGLPVPAAIATVDGGSSDRTVEAVDAVAAGSVLPIRLIGCSAPGWGAAALRGVETSRARWVGFGEPAAFALPGRSGRALGYALRLLSGGAPIVVSRPFRRCCGPRPNAADPAPPFTLMERAVARRIYNGATPGPDAGACLADTPRHAGLRVTAHGGHAVCRHERAGAAARIRPGGAGRC